jgi:hypothetical protein
MKATKDTDKYKIGENIKIKEYILPLSILALMLQLSLYYGLRFLRSILF